MTIATLRISPDEETGRIDWHKVVIYNQRLAKFAEHHLYKGSHVFIEGKLQTRQWKSKEGQVRRLTEVVLNGYDGKLFLVGDESGDHEAPPGGWRRWRDRRIPAFRRIGSGNPFVIGMA